MKKPLLIVVIILAVILVLPIINLIRWTFQVKKPLEIVLLDKTVPSLDREKHKSFNWILTNDRFVKKEKRTSYSYRKDYYGFYPTRPLRDKLFDKNDYHLADLIDIAEKTDVLYFTDTYGVFFNDWYRSITKTRKSRKFYGGLNNNDNLLIKEMKDRNKLVLLEYNTFDYPTVEFEASKVQDRIGIKYSGWTGKYFSTLDSTIDEDFPIWMTAMYRKQYKRPWTFTKPGVVLLQEKSIIVLEEGTHLTKPLPYIITDSAGCGKYNLAQSVTFDQWFDIIDPMENSVISKFRLETTSLGDSLLEDNNLENEFPAVIQDPVGKRTFYFSGDFTYKNIPYWSSRFKGIDNLKGLLYSKKPDDTRRFFWLYYKPLIKGILNEYYSSLSPK
ncbi:MAG: hypothetical protein IQL11_09940 [Bacteroidales bacterium]|nr:hypothetical protein [Bacteroidales bacterium]